MTHKEERESGSSEAELEVRLLLFVRGLAGPLSLVVAPVE